MRPRRHPDLCEDVDMAEWADKVFVLGQVKQNGSFLRYASADLQSDREVVLAAVKDHGGALHHASAELRADRQVVLVAVRENGNALASASADLCSDRELVLEAVMRSYGIALQYASDELRSDRDVVLMAVKKCGDALQWACPVLRTDRDIVLQAVRQYDYALRFVACTDEEREIILTAVDTKIAGLNDVAPVLSVDRIVERRLGVNAYLEIVAHMMSGTQVVSRLSTDANLAELAESFVEILEGVALVFVTLPELGSVTPWDGSRMVTEFM